MVAVGKWKRYLPEYVGKNGVQIWELGTSRIDFCERRLVVSKAVVGTRDLPGEVSSFKAIAEAVFEALSPGCSPTKKGFTFRDLKAIRFEDVRFLDDRDEVSP